MGRARTFDTDTALDAAMLVFWRKGFDGATLADLTAAMGIERPSLYAAFGNKEELFHRVLERYMDGPSGYVDHALNRPTAREVAEDLLRGAADLHTAPGTPGGCLVVQGALVGGGGSAVVQEALAALRRAGEEAVRDRLARAVAEGDLPPDADPTVLAGFLRTVTYGMAIRAASGATREELESVIELALHAWPPAGR
jgi:AcrR family transcriptional regulator